MHIGIGVGSRTGARMVGSASVVIPLLSLRTSVRLPLSRFQSPPHQTGQAHLTHPAFRLLVAIYKTRRVLHSIQDGFKLNMNSLFPPFDCFCLSTKDDRNGRIGYSFSGSAKRRQAPVETDLPRNNWLRLIKTVSKGGRSNQLLRPQVNTLTGR